MRGVRISRRIVLSVAGALAVCTGTAFAQGATDPNIGQGGRPNDPFTDRTSAEFTVNAVRQTVRDCVSSNDGPTPPAAPYFDIETDYRGRSNSDDPRLDGRLQVDAKALVRQGPDNGPILPDFGLANGLGEARFLIRRDDGRITSGRAFVTIGGTDTANASLVIEGVAFGRAQDTTGPDSAGTDQDFEGGDLIGNLNATANPPTGTTLSGSFGNPGGGPNDETPDNDEQPAFIQDGHCTGRPTVTVP